MHYLHTKLRVHDLDRAVRFYGSALGYRERKRKEGPHGSSLAFLALPGEDVELQLAEYPGGESFAVPEHLMHLAFRVEDVEGAVAQAIRAGGTLQSGPYALPSGSRVAFVRDPDGYPLELIQKP